MGPAAVGYTVKTAVSSVSPNRSTVLYQWLRDGKPIAVATASIYPLALNDRDKFMDVVATYSKLNYLTIRRASGIRWISGPNTV